MNDHSSSTKKVGKLLICVFDKAVNLLILLFLMIFFTYGIYSIWDGQQVLTSAQSSQYETYKPQEENSLSFQELQKINPEVFSWLSVYGTGIDLPVAQGEDNEKYVNTNVTGNYSMSGSLFLDYRNKNNFSDFSSIIYGHHMAESAMFGDLDKFQEESFFEDHRYGNLFFQGRDYGLEFYAFLQVDALDQSVYSTPIIGTENQEKYLTNIKEKAKYYRETSISSEDRIILLSTCAEDSTSGRYILVGVLREQPFSIPEALKESNLKNGQQFTTQAASFIQEIKFSQLQRFGLLVATFLLLLSWYLFLIYQRQHPKKGGPYAKK
ncbi:class B sortase [Enterococcus timonensis]|uniref:class B sortase n=1 Tax=Enterococcus timonensis TaxID=1852364 RepID=UPI001F3DAD55|nr:class B sortase [Enterococcus timonensis]